MKIKEITWQSRRDFNANLECEHCGNIELLNSGYDDSYYHKEVIPKMKCKKCGKNSGENYIPLKPKYLDNQTV